MNEQDPILIANHAPKEGLPVLVWYDHCCWRVMLRHGNAWYDADDFFDDSGLPITHWLPLPPPPQDVEE